MLFLSLPGLAQVRNPVYTDDSPVARDTLLRVAEFESRGDLSEAVRELQRLLDQEPDRVVPDPGYPGVYLSVRSVVHQRLLASPALLERYRTAENEAAEQALSASRHGAVETSRLLTRAGFEAALRVAQEHLEAARFEAARITLEQLERHPDRRSGADPNPGRDAARLLAAVARYLDRPEVTEMAARWSAESGLDAGALGPAPRPPGVLTPVATLSGPATAVDAGGIPGRPLWAERIQPEADTVETARDPRARAAESAAARDDLWVVPTVVGDTIYMNDGRFISARDRFTLQTVWRLEPPSPPDEGEDSDLIRRATSMVGIAHGLEDTANVSVSGRVAVATTGLAFNGGREGDPRTHALDAGTGRRLWSADISRVDPQLAEASERGPALIDGDTVVLVARKSAQGRRVVSVYLVGLSLQSGVPRWVRLVASAGAHPYRVERGAAEAATLYRGVVYMSDQLGVAAAVESATGRPLWVRALPVPDSAPPDNSFPWQWSSPVPDGPSVFVLSPDRGQVLALDRVNGRTVSERSASELGDPMYILKAGDQIACVGASRVALVPEADLKAGAVRLSPDFGDAGVRGRVLLSGDRLAVPVLGGLAFVDPARPSQELPILRLDKPGNILPLPSQILALDSTSVYSYVAWSVAQGLLQERIASEPDNPSPAITYAELSYRAGHHDLIASAADTALGAIDRGAGSEASRSARRRLFESLREMVEASQRRASDPAAPPARRAEAPARPTRTAIPVPRGSSVVRREPPQPAAAPAATLPALDLPVLALVIDRMSRAGQTPDDRVSYDMALGRLREDEGSPALAAEAYQHVLGDPALASATWRGAGARTDADTRREVRTRAELEATRRLRQLVIDHGPGAYAAFDAEVRQQADALGAAPAPESLERLAARYPASVFAPALWLRAGELHEQAGRGQAAVVSLREALLAAENCRAAGQESGPEVLSEAAGRLVARLTDQQQFFAAAQLLARLQTDYPGLVLTDRASPLNPDQLTSDLIRRLAALERLPRIGPDILPDVQTLEGWSILPLMTPGRDRPGRACEHVVMISEARGQIALWGMAVRTSPAAEAQTGPRDALQILWSREYKPSSPPRLVRLDPESVYLLWDEAENPSLERIDAVTGQTRWKTEPLGAIFATLAEAQRRAGGDNPVVNTPIDGPKRVSSILLVMDEQAIVLAERSGRVAAFDPASGRLLWRARTAVDEVYDAAAGEGFLVLAGATIGDTPESRRPMVAVLDEVSGRELHRIDALSGLPRLVRMARGGTALVGLEVETVALDLVRGGTRWSYIDGPSIDSLDAWVFGDRVFLLDSARTLWLGSASTGQFGEQRLDTFEHLDAVGPIVASTLGPERSITAFSTARGVVMLDPAGRLIGMDSVGSETLLPPELSQKYFVALDASPAAPGPDAKPVYRLHVLDTSSAKAVREPQRLVMYEPPRAMAILDGRIVVTAGNVTLVYSAPETER